MKIKTGFVTNSSTTNFVVVNTTKEDLSLRDFFLENMYLVKSFMEKRISEGYYGEDDEVDENIDAWIENFQIGPYGILYLNLTETYNATGLVLKNMEPAKGKSKRFIWMRNRE